MRVFGFAGWSGSGKTTLIEHLVPRFIARGLTVSLIKHAHHEFDLDQPGKDSFRHREAGCREVLVTSAVRWALHNTNCAVTRNSRLPRRSNACPRVIWRW